MVKKIELKTTIPFHITSNEINPRLNHKTNHPSFIYICELIVSRNILTQC